MIGKRVIEVVKTWWQKSFPAKPFETEIGKGRTGKRVVALTEDEKYWYVILECGCSGKKPKIPWRPYYGSGIWGREIYIKPRICYCPNNCK